MKDMFWFVLILFLFMGGVIYWGEMIVAAIVRAIYGGEK